MSSGIPISKSEIEACQEIVQNFRVNELHQLVTHFKYPKLGKKQELVNRALSILSNPKYQVSAVQKVREIQASTRTRDNMQPYPSNTGAMANQQQQQAMNMNPTNNQMHHQNHYIHQQAQAGMPPAAPAGMSRPGNFSPNFNFLANAYAANIAAYGAHVPILHNYPPVTHPLVQPQPHIMPQQSTGLVKNLHVVELPFYDMLKVVVPMTELPSYVVPTRPGEGRYSCTFGVAPEDISKLGYANDQPLPRIELQLRVFLLETSEEQQDSFPPGTVVKLDDYNVHLPPVIPTNKPNAEQKRYPRPVDLTPYCRPARSRDRPHRLQFEWNGDRRAWAFTICLVRRLNSDILRKRILENANARRTFEKTKDSIIRRLNGSDEDDVQMDTLKISLIDPLTRTRINIPIRSADCTHLQSFDLYSYLMMNEKRPGWRCPVCDKNAIYSKLIIDDYFERMLSNVGNSIDEVELLRDGNWRTPKVNNTVCLDSDDEREAEGDEEIMIVEKPGKPEKKKESVPPEQEQPSNKTQAVSKEKEVDIICLSSDDEDEQLANAIAASTVNTTKSASGTPSSTSAGRQDSMSNQQNANGTAGSSALQNGHNGGQSGGQNKNTSTPTTPVLQTNGQQPIFRPTMDELAKTQIAQNLAIFLHGIYSKNNQMQVSNSHC